MRNKTAISIFATFTLNPSSLRGMIGNDEVNHTQPQHVAQTEASFLLGLSHMFSHVTLLWDSLLKDDVIVSLAWQTESRTQWNMAFEEKRACLWHAYNALDDQRKGAGIKSQLKVLTHNIATSLGIQDVEKGLDDYRSSNNISFQDFLYFIKVDVFGRFKDVDLHKSQTTLEKVDEVCWLVSAKKYLNREGKILQDKEAYRLWRIFNFLSERNPETDGDLLYPVVIDSEEVHMLIMKFLTIAGRICEPTEHEDLTRNHRNMEFEEFLAVFETRCCGGLEKEVIDYTLQDMYDEFITQILMKGLMVKKGHVITNWRERWFVLTPNILRYYTARDERELKGEVIITANCKVEMLPEKTGAKPNRFQLICEGKAFEFSAPDVKTRSEWVSALRSAIEQCSKKQSLQRIASQQRKIKREERRVLEKVEAERRKKESELIEQTKLQLEKEREARAEAEAKLHEELNRRAAEEEKRKELEAIREELSALLEEERQAKRDEEIVRNLQARILAEEFEKRDQLERLKEEQENMLKEERRRREDYAEVHKAQLREERRKLESLEKEREDIEAKLEDALKHLYQAEWAKSELQNRLKEKEQGSLVNSLARTASAGSIPFVTHRGKGAFTETEFGLNALRSPKKRTFNGNNGEFNESSEEIDCSS